MYSFTHSFISVYVISTFLGESLVSKSVFCSYVTLQSLVPTPWSNTHMTHRDLCREGLTPLHRNSHVLLLPPAAASPCPGHSQPTGPTPNLRLSYPQGPLLPLLEWDRPACPSRKGAKDIINADRRGKSLDSWCVA